MVTEAFCLLVCGSEMVASLSDTSEWTPALSGGRQTGDPAFRLCGGPNNPLLKGPEVSPPYSLEPVRMAPTVAKGALQPGFIKDLEAENHPGLSSWAQGPSGGSREVGELEELRTERLQAGFEDEGLSCQGVQWSLEAGKGRKG